MRNRQIVLASRPKGEARESDFRLVETELRPLGAGEVLTRVCYLSLDPYMRGRMDEARSYAPPQPVGEVMVGGTVAEVIESRNPKLARGDLVLGSAGWQEYQITDGATLRKLDTSRVPASAYLGCVGMPGITAWYGLTRLGQPKPGETVVISAAAGAVGGVVGQLAKILGCRAVGIAGGEWKGDHVRQERGIDVAFENVGGEVLDGSLARMNPFGRVVICGLISGYSSQEFSLKNVRSILVNRLRVQGFIVSDHPEIWPQAIDELREHVIAGRVRYRETVAHGLENAPRAFLGMLRGENLGKQLVKLI